MAHGFTITQHDAGAATIETPACMFCGATSRVEVTADQADRLMQREPIQNVMPDVDRAERELIISGTHPICWTELFG